MAFQGKATGNKEGFTGGDIVFVHGVRHVGECHGGADRLLQNTLFFTVQNDNDAVTAVQLPGLTALVAPALDGDLWMSRFTKCLTLKFKNRIGPNNIRWFRDAMVFY